MKKLALSGLMFAGKDHIAKQAGFQALGFADAIYKIVKHYWKSDDKNNPEIRKALQCVGQLGRGNRSTEVQKFFKNQPQAFIRQLQQDWLIILGHEYGTSWSQYGERPDFWVQILLERLEKFPQDIRIAVTNVRFENELDALHKVGFHHYLVACTEETRRMRGTVIEETHNDISEQYAKWLLQTLPDNRVIWNDKLKMPEGKKYLWAEEFIKLATIA